MSRTKYHIIRSIILIGCILLLLSMLSIYGSTPRTVQAASYDSVSTGIYFLRNVYSGKYLDVCQNGLTNRTKIQQFEYCAEPSQRGISNVIPVSTTL